MDERLINLQLGALLHDFGKIVRRAGLYNDNHSTAGSNYIKENDLLESKHREIYDITNYHHAKELKFANISDNSLAYIVYEADNIASGIDRVKYDDNMTGNEMLPLNSIFNRIRMEKGVNNKAFSLYNIGENDFNMPKEDIKKLEKSDYLNILNTIKNNIKAIKENLSPEKLNTILEETCIYFPSSAYVDYPDISYYDHVKITAAISSCMYIYDKENNITNFKEEYFSHQELRRKEKFLVVSGEFSGIQNFIYTITSKMAMKSLRGRSFYLELFIEHIIDEILSSFELSRVNLIYSGGSQFYLLLPNIDKAKEILCSYKDIINDFLLKEVGTSIYFEMSHTPTSAEELGNGLNEKIKKENKIANVFKRLSIETSKSKLRRYSKEQLEFLFDEDSDINKVHSYTKECTICKKSEEDEILQNNFKREEFSEIELCNTCKNYILLGKEISKIYHSKYKKELFIVEEDDIKDSNNLIFPKYPKDFVSMSIMNKDNIIQKLKQDNNIHRYYAVNSYHVGEGLYKNIWIGNYNISPELIIKNEDKKEKTLVEFQDLVKMSKGISRLAVLRADVDNLGTLFQAGFEDKSSDNPYKYVTLSKSVVLSRYLSDFFKRKINLILEKSALQDNNELFKKYCDVIVSDNTNPRNIVIVYSGGDDVFAIGTWNDIIEFAVDLRTAFAEFTNGKITLSAGIGFFDENFPVYQMAEKTGELEKLAKSYIKSGHNNPTKNSVALFGQMNDNILNHIYTWDDFINKVLYEKYSYIKSKISFEENADKVFVGKSKWYKIMQLISNRIVEDDRLDIARFAYILARISKNDKNKQNYEELKEKLLIWMKNKDDAKQLLTAIYLIIYEERN